MVLCAQILYTVTGDLCAQSPVEVDLLICVQIQSNSQRSKLLEPIEVQSSHKTSFQ